MHGTNNNMDENWRESLQQIVDLHEHATECQINKSMSSFQSLGMQLNRENVCCFFDILSNRMSETCKKVQMTYLSSMDAVQLVEKSSSYENILISVTSTPQCESKERGDLMTMNENASTEDDAQSLQLDESSADQNILPDNTETPDELTEEKSPDNREVEMPTENVSSAQANDVIDGPSNECDAKTVEDAPADAIADATDEIPSNQDEPSMVNNDQMPATDKEDTIQLSMLTTPAIQIENDDNISIDTDEDALHIDTSEAQIDDVTMTDANSENKSQANTDEIANAADTNTNTPANVDEVEHETPAPATVTSANSSPAMSPIQSSPSTSIASANPSDQAAPADHSFSMHCKPEKGAELDVSERDASEQEPSEQSEYSSEPSATVSLVKREPKIEPQSESGQLLGENTAGTSSSGDSDEQLLLGFYEKAAIQMIDSSLKRKDLADLDVACSAAKKFKPSQEMENGAAVQLMELPAGQMNHANIAAIQMPHEIAVPKNTDPNVHCQNASYLSRCMICHHIDPSLINHYRIAHPDSDVFISRPSPAMVERMMNKGGCTISKDGKISAFCFFCEKSDTMPEMEWRQHLMAHTGELEFYCTGCRTQWAEKVQHGNCLIANSMASVFDNADGNSSMTLFMCKWCNYVQVHKAHIIRHLEHEHTTIDTNFNRNIEKVIFIPDLKPLTWRISSGYEFVREEDRFRCGYPKCTVTKRFRDFDEFEQHLKDRHNVDQYNFSCPHCHEVVEKQGRHSFHLDLLKHFRLHGRLLAECTACNKQCECNYKILNHILTVHPTECIRYRCTYIEANNDIEKRECTIWLQCKVCRVRVENFAKSVEHFLSEHKSHNIDFNAIKMVKRTTREGITSCFTSSDRHVYNCWRTVACNMCDMAMKTKLDLLEHFNYGHPKQEIMLRTGKMHISQCKINDPPMAYLNFADNLVFYCTHCHDAVIAGESNQRRAYNAIQDVHTHWQRIHSAMAESKPFRFYAVEFVLCVHCKFIGSFEAVKYHAKHLHPEKMLAISNLFDAKACALCPYVGDNLGQHIKIDHELIMRTNTINPTRFTDNTLKRLINDYVHTKFKCTHCELVFETIKSAQTHSTMKHTAEPFKYTKYTDESIKLIAGCCEATLELHEFLDHLADPSHQVGGFCTKCNLRASDTFEFVNHQVEVHQITKDANLMYRRLMFTKFWSTKVIFGNGLVVTKHNLLGTEFDDSEPFKSLIEALLAVSRERLKQSALNN